MSKSDIFTLLCLSHHNSNNNNNNNNNVKILPIKEFRDNPEGNLGITNMILFTSPDKIPFYFPTQRRKMFNAVKAIPNLLMKTFKTDDSIKAHYMYLSALSILYEYHISRQPYDDKRAALDAIRNALIQETQLLAKGKNTTAEKEKDGIMKFFYNYGEPKELRTSHWYDLCNITIQLQNMSDTDRQEMISICGGGDGFQDWIIPQFLLLHLSIITASLTGNANESIGVTD